MNQVTTIGLDIAKSIFQVHGVDAARQSVLRQRLSRSRVLEFFGKLPRCLVGLEACASSHYWARELIRLGHEVKLMPAQMLAAQLEGVKAKILENDRRIIASARATEVGRRLLEVPGIAAQKTLANGERSTRGREEPIDRLLLFDRSWREAVACPKEQFGRIVALFTAERSGLSSWV
jgi:transposase